ncbi:polyprenyl synthetase family protein [Thermincola potens]|uniref:Farnesyl diphosphate synthase n=1 Tax=Thermincola potens (strain JR) TaxID=635013 RepID=D5X7I0_THEPJ|nr:farnesyl diphosphate synthase [Thermincola potens]ADG82550.1 Polyprenyl synthetase [Thermincola potens JR]
MNKKAFLKELKRKVNIIEEALSQYLPGEDEYPETIHQSMRYSMLAGGKRLRPVLVLAAAEAVGGDVKKVIPAACAIEMIHTYSLIHDDLPAMDDDNYRRGKPTNHVVYGEAIAILAGDALLTLAFEVLSSLVEEPGIDPQKVLRVIKEISLAAGSRGLIGGQVVDIGSENLDISAETLKYIHIHKTGALFKAALKTGAILSSASEEQITALSRYAHFLGLGFQITDDILDIEGDTEKLGKPVGSDIKKKKATYPSIFGLQEAKQMAREAVAESLMSLEGFDERADFLREMARYLLERDN